MSAGARDIRPIVIGLGVQGRKRHAVAGADVVATVDPLVSEADYATIDEVPLDAYDAALVCAPDAAKHDLLTQLLNNGKHILVEKPLLAENTDRIRALEKLAASKNLTCYTAYNHRFEPHLVRLKETMDAGELGDVYFARFFYGNGTARDVRNSPWRDTGAGVLTDLGSHLLDIALFLFGERIGKFRVHSANRFENRAFDHVLFGNDGFPALTMEVTLVSWRNDFVADVYGQDGSAHVRSLCKWGPTIFTKRGRVLPSGRPHEESIPLEQDDPTWALEYDHFVRLCEVGGTNLANDILINDALLDLADDAFTRFGRTGP